LEGNAGRELRRPREEDMARSEVAVKKTGTILDELDRLHQAISQRAHELFRNGESWGDALADWLSAERELISRPAVELRQKDGQFELLAALPGIEAKDIDVEITPEEVLIKAESSHENKVESGTVRLTEFGRGRVFRSVRFPEKINPDTTRAEYKNGILRVTASISESGTKSVQVKAA
jgi:HSP20 family molecular chaperone IbpA